MGISHGVWIPASPELGRTLRQARKSRGWTALQLGNAVHMDQTNIFRWEAGKPRAIPVEDLVRVAAVLGAPEIIRCIRRQIEAVLSQEVA